MSPKKPKLDPPPARPARKPPVSGSFVGADGLGPYIANPESYPPSVVVYFNEHFVVIHDLYPKSSLHLLLLPRDPDKMLLHPIEAFQDEQFLSKVQAETQKVRQLVAKELRRKYGKFSAQDQEREEAMEAEPPPDELPSGRDWEKEVISGIHRGPSMNHLHVHILSVDRFSVCMKKKKHYNSFNTPFFIPVEDFPLARDDPRVRPKVKYLDSDLVCWRCGKNFGNKFARLKEHLAEEFDLWKQL